MNNILLIGGAGFIGSSLVRRFVRGLSWHVIVLEPERSNKTRLSPFLDKIDLEEGDLRDVTLILQIIDKYDVKVVVHLASTMIPGSTMSHLQSEFSDITMPTLNTLEICAQKGVKFVYFSSGGTVYGNSKMIHHESDPCEPISYYGLSKLMTEEMIRFMHRTQGLQYLILRPSNPYGPGQNLYGRQGLIAVTLGKLIDSVPVVVRGDGSAVRDYIYIEDLADAVFQLIDKGVANDTFNIGSGVGYSVNEILTMIKSLTGDKLQINYVPSSKSDVYKMILDNQKLRNTVELDLTDIRTGIEKFIDYAKSNRQ